MEPRAVGSLSRRLDRGSVVVSATNGKTTTAGMIASVLRQARRDAGAQPRRREHAGRRRDRAARADRRRRRSRRSGCSRSTRPGSRRRRPALPPHRPARQPVPRPARPLRRARAARRRLGALVAARAGRHRVRAERRRSAGRRPRAGPRRRRRAQRVTYFGIEDRSHALERIEHAFDAKHCRRCGTAYRTRPRTSVTSATTAARTAATRARSPRWRRARVELRGHVGLAIHAHLSGAARSSSRCGSPASTTSTTRSRRPPAASQLGIDAGRDAARPRVLRRRFGRAEQIESGPQRSRSC